jgi:hypothetical protein
VFGSRLSLFFCFSPLWQTLLQTYKETLGVLASMPATAAYRKNVEILTQERLSIVESNDCLDTIEATIGGGQIEQLQVQVRHRRLNFAQRCHIFTLFCS